MYYVSTAAVTNTFSGLKKYKFLINAGEGVEKGEPFYAVGRNVNCTTIIEKTIMKPP